MFTKRENEERLLFVIRWAARLLSGVVLALLVFFYFGEGLSNVSPRDYVGFLFFPIGLLAGFIIAWRNELVGGAVSTVSVGAFYFIYGLLLSGSIKQGWSILVFGIPGLLFLLYGFFARSWFPASWRASHP